MTKESNIDNMILESAKRRLLGIHLLRIPPLLETSFYIKKEMAKRKF